jgi:folate-binding protein YgfZ
MHDPSGQKNPLCYRKGMEFCAHLSDRFSLRIAGPDRQNFLQGLVSNDMGKVTSSEAIYAALLTPQGKFLHDLFILADGDSYLVDCERPEDLIRRLTAYKLRAKVTFEMAAFDIWAIWNGQTNAPHAYRDPGLPELGSRVFVPKGEKLKGENGDYELHRLTLGVTSSADMEIEKSTLAEGNFDFLHGIDWKKGCYVGQELTARMHYRGLAKRRLFPVMIEGEAPAPGTQLDNDVGEMRTSRGAHGLALLKIDVAAAKTPLTCGKIVLYSEIHGWMKLT